MPQPQKIQPQPERSERELQARAFAAQVYPTPLSQALRGLPISWAGSTRMTPEARAYRGKGWA